MAPGTQRVPQGPPHPQALGGGLSTQPVRKYLLLFPTRRSILVSGAWQRNIATLSLSSRSLSPYFYLSLVHREPRFWQQSKWSIFFILTAGSYVFIKITLEVYSAFLFLCNKLFQNSWFKTTTVSYLTSFESGIWAGLSWMIPFSYMASVRVS